MLPYCLGSVLSPVHSGPFKSNWTGSVTGRQTTVSHWNNMCGSQLTLEKEKENCLEKKKKLWLATFFPLYVKTILSSKEQGLYWCFFNIYIKTCFNVFLNPCAALSVLHSVLLINQELRDRDLENRRSRAAEEMAWMSKMKWIKAVHGENRRPLVQISLSALCRRVRGSVFSHWQNK